MTVRSFAAFEASLATQLDIHAEIAFLIRAIDAPAPREIRLLPLATAFTLVMAAAGQALAQQARHVVIAGESLYRIAARELGSGNRWKGIARLNHLANPGRIMIGQILEMPAITPSLHSRGAVAQRDRIRRSHMASPVEVVPAGRIVAELPARSVLTPDRHQAIPDPRRAIADRHRVMSEPGAPFPPWKTLDMLAFVAGAVAGLRFFALHKLRPSARRRQRPAAVLAAATGDFWGHVPASGDLQSLEASCEPGAPAHAVA